MVGRLVGAPIIITPSWLLTALVITMVFAPTVSASAPQLGNIGVVGVAFAFAVLLALSVFLHEVAHALMASRLGQQVTELAVTLWGGHTAFSNRANKPGQEALVAVVGPLTNLLLAGIFFAVYQMLPFGTIPSLLSYAAFFSNMFVGLFNLLPGLPLDGGQILEALVWKLTGWRTRGTLVAGWAGRLVGLGVVAWYFVVPLLRGQQLVLTNAIWMLLIASFLWQGAGQAIKAAARRELISSFTARNLMMRTVALPQDATIAQARIAAVEAAKVQDVKVKAVKVQAAGMPATDEPAANEVIADGGAANPPVLAVVNSHKEPIGWLAPEALAQVPDNVAPRTPITAALVPFQAGSAVPITASGLQLLRHVDATSGGARVIPVVDSAGQLAGVLDIHALASQLAALGAKR